MKMRDHAFPREMGPREMGPRKTGPRKTGPGETGFTLVELMVVLVIIGLLATVVLIKVLPALDTAKATKAKADVETLDQAVEMYKLNTLNYPSGGDGLHVLVTARLIKKLPNDPWGRPYVYASPGQHGAVDIYTLGADGAPGGEGENADIGNWE
jgi:general secretion pathway protein G